MARRKPEGRSLTVEEMLADELARGDPLAVLEPLGLPEIESEPDVLASMELTRPFMLQPDSDPVSLDSALVIENKARVAKLKETRARVSLNSAERMALTRSRRLAGLLLLPIEVADTWPLLLAELGYLREDETENRAA